MQDCGIAAASVKRPFCNAREPSLLQRVSQGDEVSPDPEEPSVLVDAVASVPNGIAEGADSRLLREELAVAKLILDQNGIVLYRARMEEGLPIEYVSGNVAHFGYSAEQIQSGAVRFEDVVHPADRDRVLATLHDHVAHGRREFIQHYRIIAARGALLWIEDRTYVRDIADGAGIYLEGIVTDVTERHRAQERLRQSLTQTIGAVAATIDKRDPYTAGHQRRVAALSRAIAEQLGLGADQTEGVYLGALVHDVGKMAIPVDILSRPGRLSFEEFALVKTHVRAGVDVLRDVVFPWPIIDMVAQHHERLNGSGYPAGLSGESIRLEARIIAVADVFESMSTHRPYRPALAVDVALDELSRGRSALFDADAVDACLAIARVHAGDHAALWATLEQGRDASTCAGNVPLTKIDPARD